MVVLVGLVGLRIVIKVSLGLFKVVKKETFSKCDFSVFKGVTFSIRLEIEHLLIFN